MNPTLRQLQAFVSVVEKSSFTRAARDLHLTQSAMSLLIRELESTMRTRLIDRTTRSVNVTAVGLEFFTSAQRLLADLDHAMGNVAKLVANERGRVVIAAPLVLSGTFLPVLLAGFRDRYSGIDLVLKDSLPDQVLPHVRSGAADLGIGTFHHTEDDLSKTLLFRESLVAVFPSQHPFARLARLTWKDLKNAPILALPRESVFRLLAEDGFTAAGVPFKPAFEATYVGTLIGLVSAGMGVAIIPGYATQLADRRTVKWIKLERPVIQRDVLLVHRTGRSLSPAARTFADHVLDHCRSR